MSAVLRVTPARKQRENTRGTKSWRKLKTTYPHFGQPKSLAKKSPSKEGLGFRSLRVLLLFLFLHNSCRQEHTHALPSVLPSPSPPASPEMSHLQSPTPATRHNTDASEIHVCVPPSHQRGVVGENCRQINREGEKLIREASHFSVAGSKWGCSNSAELIN